MLGSIAKHLRVPRLRDAALRQRRHLHRRRRLNAVWRKRWPNTPLGVHISLIIIDAVIDLPKTRAHMTDKPNSYFVSPNDVAAIAEWLTQQPHRPGHLR